MTKDKKDGDEPPRNRGKRNDNKDDSNQPPKRRRRNNPPTPPPEEAPLHIFFQMPPPFMNGLSGGNLGGGGDGIPAKYKQLKDRIMASNMDDKVKETVLLRLKTIDSDKQKHLEWFELLLKIPFKKFSNIPVSKDDGEEKLSNYFDSVYETLDKATYGMQQVKEEIVNFVAQIVSTNNTNMPRIIGLHGSAGVGKTALIRRGLSECLNRPMKNFSCGGIRDSAFLNGFSFTYSGSRPGALVNGLIDTGSMNSIFFFDELDKISTTNDGIDIQNMLIHLTDPVQNNDFQDKYFEGIPIDLSKIIFIFSFNDIGLISPILKDRLHIIKVPDPDIKEKVIIGTKYLTKELYPNIGLKDEDIVFSEDIMKYIIKEHCEHDKGVRNLKRCIETILLKINTARFIGKRNKYKSLKGKLTFPTQVTTDMVDELIDKNKNDKDEFFRSMFI
jgi:ATP-dependent Lon protease